MKPISLKTLKKLIFNKLINEVLQTNIKLIFYYLINP